MASTGANLTQSLKKINNLLPILPISNPDFSKMGMVTDEQNGVLHPQLYPLLVLSFISPVRGTYYLTCKLLNFLVATFYRFTGYRLV